MNQVDNTIRVKMLSHSYMAVESSPSQEQELREYFSFYVPGYKFMPAYKRKQWDGKIKLYNQVTKQLHVGLYTQLRKFCADRFYPLQIIDDYEWGTPNAKNKISHPELVKFLGNLGAPYETRDYQYDAIAHSIENKRCVLLSPTGSGKSFIIYNTMRWIEKNENGKILVVVPTTSLVEQMYGDFKEYGLDVENNVHMIYSGKDKVTEKRIVISTWQSIYKFPREWFQDFTCIFGDEVHLFKAKSLGTLMDKCANARYRIGTTGTLDGTETNKLVLEGLFGPVFKVTTTVKLQEDKTLAELDIKVLLLRYHNDECVKMKGKTYQEEIEYIVTNEKRNNFVKNLALDQKGNTLVLFQFVEKHGKVLYDLIRKASEDDRKVFYVSGEVEASDREQIRGIVEKQENAIIVASLGTFSTGINIRNLHNIIFASPSKSQIRVLQSIGRGLRVSGDNINTTVYDIADDLHYKSKKNYTLDHAAERIKIYSKEKFKYKIYEINI